MKLALEIPTGLLDQISPFSDFEFILASVYLKDKVYADFYRQSTRSKIVDNSVNEDGEPLPVDKIVDVFKDCRADYLVSPDWIGDSVRTRKAYLDTSEKVGKDKTIGVVQGSTFEDAIECLDMYQEAPLVAIPYDICSKKTDSPQVMAVRRALLISNMSPDTKIHLLGFDSIDEFIWYQLRPNVVSIDTGIPVYLGLEEKDILEDLPDKKLPTFNLMKDLKLTQKSFGTICRNIALLRKYL